MLVPLATFTSLIYILVEKNIFKDTHREKPP